MCFPAHWWYFEEILPVSQGNKEREEILIYCIYWSIVAIDTSREMYPVTGSYTHFFLRIAHCHSTLASLGPAHMGLWQQCVPAGTHIPPQGTGSERENAGPCLLCNFQPPTNFSPSKQSVVSLSPCPIGLLQLYLYLVSTFLEGRKHHSHHMAFACWISSWNGERKYFNWFWIYFCVWC